MFPTIVQVYPKEDYKVYVYFDDGKIVCFDATTIIEKPVFKPLKDINIFLNSCKIMNDTLAWDIMNNNDPSTCIDIDPDTLYSLDNVVDLIA